jgi:hypothetical protein
MMHFAAELRIARDRGMLKKDAMDNLTAYQVFA